MEQIKRVITVTAKRNGISLCKENRTIEFRKNDRKVLTMTLDELKVHLHQLSVKL